MDFCELDDPFGHVGKARDILEFINITLCTFGVDEEISLNYTQRMGLAWILAACSETLKKAEEQAEEEKGN